MKINRQYKSRRFGSTFINVLATLLLVILSNGIPWDIVSTNTHMFLYIRYLSVIPVAVAIAVVITILKLLERAILINAT
jgi:hypothetical protein